MIEAMNRLARFFDGEYADYDEDIPTLKAFAQRTGGPILELGCGAGRALLPLARAGYAVTGVDLSPAMLAVARDKAQAAGLTDRVTLIEGDFATATLGGPYRLAFVAMNTFMHLTTQTAQLRGLRHWRASLAHGGLLLIDLFNPDMAQLAGLDNRLELDRSWRDPLTGRMVMKFLARTADPATQILDVTLIYDELSAEGALLRTLIQVQLRYLWRYEAVLLLDKAGYEVEAVYGGWDLQPYAAGSQRLILAARRRD
jgi:SAM-dependent methyltransferase